MNLHDVSELTAKISTLWPGFKVTPGLTNKAIFEALSALNVAKDEAHRVVALLLVSDTKFFPAPNVQDLLGAIKHLRSHTPGKKKPTPEEGWAKLCDCAARGWTWERVQEKLSERAKYAIRSIGGWDKIRFTPTEDLPFLRKDFIAAYSQMEVRDEKYESLEFSNSSEISRLVNSTAKNLSSLAVHVNHLTPQNIALKSDELAATEVGR